MATPAKNLNALLVGTIEFSFSDGATSAADAKAKGYRDVGNVISLTPNFDPTVVEHYGSYRGVRRRDKVITTQQKLEFSVKVDQFDKLKATWSLGATAGTNFTQTGDSSVSADAWAFSAGSPSGTEKWYDVLNSGNRRRYLTALTIATLVEGTDFEVDYTLGRVRFLVSQTTSRTAVYSCPVVTSSDDEYMEGLKPMQDVRKQGYGRLICYDQDANMSIVWDYTDFSCDLTVESVSEIDGTKTTEITLKVSVTEDVGNFLIRKANTP